MINSQSDFLLSRPSMSDPEFKKVSQFIESHLGIRMPYSKKTMIESRLYKRLRFLKISSYKEYLSYLFSSDGTSKELSHFEDVVTTNKTDFFREKSHFDFLKNNLLIPYNKRSDREFHFKVWSAACSSGEEVYTLAIVLQEVKDLFTNFSFEVDGTDISKAILNRAISGIYDQSDIEVLTPQQKSRFFLKSKKPESSKVKVKDFIKETVSFSKMNLMDNSYSLKKKYHVIFCRNVLIYFPQDKQREVITKFYDHLEEGGYLFLGHSESLVGQNTAYESIAPTIYRKGGRRK